MVFDVKTAGALISGGITKTEDCMNTKRVKVLRAFWDGKNPLSVGDFVALPEGIARQAVAAKKAEFVGDEVGCDSPIETGRKSKKE
jgi:hypothetical protein